MNACVLTKLRDLCDRYHVDYEIYLDQLPLKTARAGATEYGIDPSETAPTLILKVYDNMIAVILRGDTRISFRKLKMLLNAKHIHMAKASDVYSVTNAGIGEVSLINRQIQTYIDKKLLKKAYVFGGCGVKNCTLKIRTDDLIKLTNATILDFADFKRPS